MASCWACSHSAFWASPRRHGDCGDGAALMAFVALRLVVGVSVDPSSHNLWPFEILLTGSLSVAIMIAVVVARKVTGANRAS
jgi:hypothetical protein